MSQTPPFLLTFEIFNWNVHSWLVDYGDSSNVMPYLVCKKLNANPHICKTKIIQLDNSNVNVMGKLKDVLICLTQKFKVHKTIDIIFLDILEAYGVILSRDWSAKINGYFSTDQSHLWLPYKGQLNKIKVEQEQYMKHMVTDLNYLNGLILFYTSILNNFYFETLFCELNSQLSPNANSYTQFELH